MKIGEIPANATIQIRVMKGDKKFECMAVVVATRDDGLYLAPVKHQGQLIDFSGEQIQVLAFYVNQDRQAFGWSGCRIRKDTYQGKMCHVLVTKRDSVRVNRREEPRIRTEMNAILRSVIDDREREIIVRNYSENGVGFVCAKKVPERDWSPCMIIYEDRLQNLRVSMRVHILREMELTNGLFRYGAHILQPDDAWIKYVQRKLEELRERSREAEDETGGTHGR